MGVVLDSELDFSFHIEHKIKRCNKIIGLLGRLSVCNSFIRPHLDYGNILYDKTDNQNFESKIKKVQYKACLAITGAIQGTFTKSLYEELGLMPFKRRRCYNKLTFCYETVNGLLSHYLQSYTEASFQDNYFKINIDWKLKSYSITKKMF